MGFLGSNAETLQLSVAFPIDNILVIILFITTYNGNIKFENEP